MPPYIRTPYVPSTYDRRSGHLSDLIRAQGAAQARGVRESGAISAQLAGNLGQTIGGALSQLTQYQMGEPQRKHEQMLRDEQGRKIREEANVRGVDQMSAGLKENERADLFDQAGYRDKALQIRDSERARTAQQFDLTAKQTAEQRRQMSEAAQILNEIEKTPEPQRPQAYQMALGRVRSLVGEQYAQHIPEAYDPANVQTMIKIGATAEDRLKWVQMAAAEASLAHTQSSESREAFNHSQKSVLFALKAANTPEEWKNAWGMIDAHVKDEGVKKMFSREFSSEAVCLGIVHTYNRSCSISNLLWVESVIE